MKLPEIKFYEDTHTYEVGEGRIVPSVTQILTDMGFIDTRWFAEQDAIRGKYVHQACQFYDEGDLDFDSLDDIIKPYVESYIKWKEEAKFIIRFNEKLLYNKFQNYCGTLDRTGILNGKYSLIDLKSGVPQRWAALQTAGYKNALTSMGLEAPLNRFALTLRKNGKIAHLKPHTDPHEGVVWGSIVNVYHWKHAA